MKHLFILHTASSEPRERLTAATNGRLKQGPCVSIKLKKGNAHKKKQKCNQQIKGKFSKFPINKPKQMQID